MRGSSRFPVVAALIVSLLTWQLRPPAVLAQAATPGADRVERLFTALEDASSKLPRDLFTADGVLLTTDLTPEGAFAWVRDNTHLVAYQGALRGVTGMLLDRSGNSLDRALLLQNLIDGLGYDTRLARAELSAEQLEVVVAAARAATADASNPLVSSIDTAEIESQAATFDIDAAELIGVMTSVAAAGVAMQAEIAARVDVQTPALAQVAGASATEHLVAEQRRHLSQHWWLQYQDNGAWLDLDPTLPDAAPGDSLAVPAETLDVFGIAELPAELVHSLTLRVVLECAVDGALTETVLVEVAGLVPAQLIGRRISVYHVGSGLPAASTLDLDTIADTVMENDNWFPVISVGTSSTYDLEFNASDCGVAAPSVGFLGGAINRVLGDVDSLFGDALAAEGDAVTAMHIEYVVNVPGEAPASVRRSVFDALGEADRQAGVARGPSSEDARRAWRLALLGETEILATVGRLDERFVMQLVVDALLAQAPVVVATLDAATDEEVNALSERAAAVQPVPSALYGLAISRQTDMPNAVYQDRLNLLNRHGWLAEGADAAVGYRQAFDFVVNQVASTSASSQEVVAQGVRDTNAETLLERSTCEVALAAEFCTLQANAGDLLAAGGADWVTVTSETELVALAWPEDALARARRDLQDGYSLLAPTNAPANQESHWWRVDPTTGATLGVSERGWGATAVEYSFILTNVSFYYCLKGGGGTQRSIILCGLGYMAGGGAAVLAAGPAGVAFIFGLAAAILMGEGGLGS